MTSEILQIALSIGFGIFVLWLLGQMVKYTTSGYISLENQNKTLLQNLFEGIVGFIKIFKFW